MPGIPDLNHNPMKSSAILYQALTALLLSVLFLATSCKKDSSEALEQSVYCDQVSNQQWEESGSTINSYLKTLTEGSSDQKLEKLKLWLEASTCVQQVDILCNSCIETLPPQSELLITFTINGQNTTRTLDILMSDPMQYRAYH